MEITVDNLAGIRNSLVEQRFFVSKQMYMLGLCRHSNNCISNVSMDA